jgi:uncharacterized protein
MSTKRLDGAHVQGKLDASECGRLREFQRTAGVEAMSLEAIDGFFAALVCGPEFVAPSEYLPEVWGMDHAFDNEQEMQSILSLLLRHWNHIADTLLKGKNNPSETHVAILDVDAAGFMSGNAWAEGFMKGVRLRPGTWRRLMLDPKDSGWLTAVLALVHEHSSDAALRSPLLARDKRAQLLTLMQASVPRIYKYFEADRRRARVATTAKAREMPKLGRNDLCHCGSGKKFKTCCLSLQ